MKYDHAIKYNGVIYPTGAEVPVEEKKEVNTQEEDHQVEKTESSEGEKVKEPKKK